MYLLHWKRNRVCTCIPSMFTILVSALSVEAAAPTKKFESQWNSQHEQSKFADNNYQWTWMRKQYLKPYMQEKLLCPKCFQLSSLNGKKRISGEQILFSVVDTSFESVWCTGKQTGHRNFLHYEGSCGLSDKENRFTAVSIWTWVLLVCQFLISCSTFWKFWNPLLSINTEILIHTT